MSCVSKFSLAGATAAALIAGSLTAAEAAPVPATSATALAGGATVDQVQYRAYGPRYGYRGGGYGYRGGYRRGIGPGGAIAAGAALGVLGAAAAASAYPAYGYPAYAYPAPAYGYPAYGYPAYGYGYAPY